MAITKTSRSARPGAAFWSLPAGDVLQELAAGSQGLTSAEAVARLAAAGPNRLEEEKQTTTLQLLARQFASPLVLLLAFAAVLSLVVRAAEDAVIILLILLASGLLGFWQERGAADAVRKLLRRIEVQARVLRVPSSAAAQACRWKSRQPW